MLPLSPSSIPFTQSALDEKKAELAALIIERKAVVGRLKVAREMGDLSENGAYTAAKFELGRVGRRMRYLRHLVNNGYVKKKQSTDTVDFGATFTLTNDKGSVTYMLVSQHESNPREHKVSLESPIGQAVVGKRVGEMVTVVTPQGQVEYQLTAIE